MHGEAGDSTRLERFVNLLPSAWEYPSGYPFFNVKCVLPSALRGADVRVIRPLRIPHELYHSFPPVIQSERRRYVAIFAGPNPGEERFQATFRQLRYVVGVGGKIITYMIGDGFHRAG